MSDFEPLAATRDSVRVRPDKYKRLSTAALTFGIIGVVLPILLFGPAIVAIVLGAIGMRTRWTRAAVGFGLGLAGLVLSGCVVLVLGDW